jgi:hypothetical protein
VKKKKQLKKKEKRKRRYYLILGRGPSNCHEGVRHPRSTDQVGGEECPFRIPEAAGRFTRNCSAASSYRALGAAPLQYWLYCTYTVIQIICSPI